MLETIDPDQVLEHVDLDALLDRVDLTRLLDRIEPDALLDRIDVPRLLARVDLDALLATVDVDALLARVDLEALVRRAGIPEIVAESSGRVVERTVDLGRRQVLGLDELLGHLLDRVLRRRTDSTRLMPPRLAAVPAPSGPSDRLVVSGRYGGPLARLLAAGLDLGLGLALLSGGYVVLDVVLRAFLGWSLADHRSPLAATLAVTAWGFVYYVAGLAVAGRTPGMAVVGLRVVDAEGGPVSVRRSVVRTVVMPVSFLLGGLGLLPVVLHRQHRALHDAAAGTAVVIDWNDRPAELAAPLSAFLARSTAPSPEPAVDAEPVPVVPAAP